MTALQKGEDRKILDWLDHGTAQRIHYTCTMFHAEGSYTGITILMLACALPRANMALIAALIDRKASLDKQDSEGMTALMSASSSGSADIVRLLLEAGASASLRNSKGLTALQMADSQGNLLVKLVFKQHFAAVLAARQQQEVIARRTAEADISLRAALEADTLSSLEAAIDAHAAAAEVGGERSTALADAHARRDELKDAQRRLADAQRKAHKSQKRQRQKKRQEQEGRAGRTEDRLEKLSLQEEAEPTEAATPPQAAAAACKDEGKPAGVALQSPDPELARVGTSGDDECVVCLEAPRDHVFFPCGHLIVCAACANMIAPGGRGVCPMCKAQGGVCKVYA